MKTLSLKLPEPLLEKLDAIAKERGETRSVILREAIEGIIKEDIRMQDGSCLDLAGDLAGCAKGPTDLSFNKKHLRGYGL